MAAGQLMVHGFSRFAARFRLRTTAEDIGLSRDEQGHGLADVTDAVGADCSDNASGNYAATDHTVLPGWKTDFADSSVILHGQATCISDGEDVDVYSKCRKKGREHRG